MADLQTTLVPTDATHPPSPTASLLAAEFAARVGRFAVQRFHAKGGLGEVHVALDDELKRSVALKRIQARFHGDAVAKHRFLNEAELTAKLEHPGIVPIYGLVQDDNGQPCYAMRFIEGESLAEAVKRFHGPASREASATGLSTRPLTRHGSPAFDSLPFRQLLQRFITVCNTMAYAHSKQVIHRDLKPANVMLGPFGETLVVDWGLARELNDSSSCREPTAREGNLNSTIDLLPTDAENRCYTQAGQALGTLGYMAPEQAGGRWNVVGPCSDIYSLGATLYEILTGDRPIRGQDVPEALQNAQAGKFAAPRSVNNCVPKPLEAICLKAMALEPEQRYATAKALADDLEHWLGDEPVSAYAEPWTVRTRRWARRHRTALTAVAAVALVALVGGGGGGWWYQRESQAKHAAGLVQALLSAESARVPSLLHDLEPYRPWAEPLLRQAAADAKAGSSERLRAGLALLAVDEGQIDYLLAQVPQVAPVDLALIAAALQIHRDRVAAPLWGLATDAAIKAPQRLRAAGALAVIDADHANWPTVAPAVAGWLVAENPLLLDQWRALFQPVRLKLLPGLATIFRSGSAADAALKEQMSAYQKRAHATALLLRYAADQPRELAGLLMDADEEQYADLFAVVQALAEPQARMLVARVLSDEAGRPLPTDAKDETKEALAKRQANAAVALLRFGQAEKVWPLLQHSPDPRVRSYLLHRFAPMGADAKAIVERLDMEPDITIRRALILSLGEFGTAQWPANERQPVVDKLKDIYRTQPDAGLHGAAEWLLRRWQQDEWLRETNETLAKERDQRLERIQEELRSPTRQRGTVPTRADASGSARWYVNGQRQTMVVLPGPVEFLMGSPTTEAGRGTDETQHRRRIGRTFAIAATAVTVEQFRRWAPFFRHAQFQRYPQPSCPIGGVVWYEAAAYCNWLSHEEGIPQDQWCYNLQKDAKGEYVAGPWLAPDYLSKSGYRLPTEAEFEYACRAGATSAYCFGETAELLPKYGWYDRNSRDFTWPVGSLKPNDFGLCDMHGNTYTWCQEQHKFHDAPKAQVVIEDREDVPIIEPETARELRGGCFVSDAVDLRCALRSCINTPGNRQAHYGFRLVRTIRLEP